MSKYEITQKNIQEHGNFCKNSLQLTYLKYTDDKETAKALANNSINSELAIKPKVFYGLKDKYEGDIRSIGLNSESLDELKDALVLHLDENDIGESKKILLNQTAEQLADLMDCEIIKRKKLIKDT